MAPAPGKIASAPPPSPRHRGRHSGTRGVRCRRGWRQKPTQRILAPPKRRSSGNFGMDSSVGARHNRNGLLWTLNDVATLCGGEKARGCQDCCCAQCAIGVVGFQISAIGTVGGHGICTVMFSVVGAASQVIFGVWVISWPLCPPIVGSLIVLCVAVSFV